MPTPSTIQWRRPSGSCDDPSTRNPLSLPRMTHSDCNGTPREMRKVNVQQTLIA
jgi:hypothetical protein